MVSDKKIDDTIANLRNEVSQFDKANKDAYIRRKAIMNVTTAAILRYIYEGKTDLIDRHRGLNSTINFFYKLIRYYRLKISRTGHLRGLSRIFCTYMADDYYYDRVIKIGNRNIVKCAPSDLTARINTYNLSVDNKKHYTGLLRRSKLIDKKLENCTDNFGSYIIAKEENKKRKKINTFYDYLEKLTRDNNNMLGNNKKNPFYADPNFLRLRRRNKKMVNTKYKVECCSNICGGNNDISDSNYNCIRNCIIAAKRNSIKDNLMSMVETNRDTEKDVANIGKNFTEVKTYVQKNEQLYTAMTKNIFTKDQMDIYNEFIDKKIRDKKLEDETNNYINENIMTDKFVFELIGYAWHHRANMSDKDLKANSKLRTIKSAIDFYYKHVKSKPTKDEKQFLCDTVCAAYYNSNGIDKFISRFVNKRYQRLCGLSKPTAEGITKVKMLRKRMKIMEAINKVSNAISDNVFKCMSNMTEAHFNHIYEKRVNRIIKLFNNMIFLMHGHNHAINYDAMNSTYITWINKYVRPRLIRNVNNDLPLNSCCEKKCGGITINEKNYKCVEKCSLDIENKIIDTIKDYRKKFLSIDKNKQSEEEKLVEHKSQRDMEKNFKENENLLDYTKMKEMEKRIQQKVEEIMEKKYKEKNKTFGPEKMRKIEQKIQEKVEEVVKRKLNEKMLKLQNEENSPISELQYKLRKIELENNSSSMKGLSEVEKLEKELKELKRKKNSESRYMAQQNRSNWPQQNPIDLDGLSTMEKLQKVLKATKMAQNPSDVKELSMMDKLEKQLKELKREKSLETIKSTQNPSDMKELSMMDKLQKILKESKVTQDPSDIKKDLMMGILKNQLNQLKKEKISEVKKIAQNPSNTNELNMMNNLEKQLNKLKSTQNPSDVKGLNMMNMLQNQLKELKKEKTLEASKLAQTKQNENELNMMNNLEKQLNKLKSTQNPSDVKGLNMMNILENQLKELKKEKALEASKLAQTKQNTADLTGSNLVKNLEDQLKEFKKKNALEDAKLKQNPSAVKSLGMMGRLQRQLKEFEMEKAIKAAKEKVVKENAVKAANQKLLDSKNTNSTNKSTKESDGNNKPKSNKRCVKIYV